MLFSDPDFIIMRAQARVLLGLTAIAWIVFMLNSLFGNGLNRMFCIRPRTPWGVIGIPCSPFLHSSLQHIMGNTQGFLLLGWLVAMQGIHLFIVVTIATALSSGLGVWLFSPARTVGASGVIFGYTGFLWIYGLTAGSWIAFLAGVISLYTEWYRVLGYKVLTSSILPGSPLSPFYNPRMSWQAHLYGFLGGMFTGYLLSYLRVT